MNYKQLYKLVMFGVFRQIPGRILPSFGFRNIGNVKQYYFKLQLILLIFFLKIPRWYVHISLLY